MPLDNMLMLKGAKKLVESLAGVQPREKVMIVTDINKFSIAKIVATVAFQTGAEVFLTVIPLLKRVGSHSDMIPDLIISAMSKVDVIFVITTDSATSSVELAIKASDFKARGISMGAWTEEMLYKGGMEADFDKIAETTHAKILEIFKKAKKGEITNPAGTNITVDLVPRGSDHYAYPGPAREPGLISHPPDIEVSCRPVLRTAEGTIVVDGAICIYPDLGPLLDSVTLEISEGKIIDIKGGREARTFKKLYKEILTKEPQTNNLCEVAVGLNTSCYLTGNYFEDEGSGETMHFGFGGGYVGGQYHIDFVFKNPALKINGELVIDNGKVL